MSFLLLGTGPVEPVSSSPPRDNRPAPRPLTNLLAPLRPDPVLRDKLRAALGPTARVLESEHFLLAYTAPLPSTRRLAGLLETVYRAHLHFAEDLGLEPRPPEHKLGTLVFGEHADFCAYRRTRPLPAAVNPDGILGFYDPQTHWSVFFDLETYPPVAGLCADLDDLSRSDYLRRHRLQNRLQDRLASLDALVIQHEAAHQVQSELGLLPAGDRAPSWLIEGLATLFELPEHALRAGDLQQTNPHRLHLLTANGKPVAELTSAMQRIVGEPDGWRGGEDYALAWCLTHYLYTRQRPAFAGFLKELNNADTPSSPREIFERHFGRLDGAFARRFAAHLDRLLAPLPADSRPSSAPARP